MADLVNRNMEGMIPFFALLEPYLDKKEFQNIKVKRRQFENSLAKSRKDVLIFKLYLKYEDSVYQKLLQYNDSKLLKFQITHIARLITQMETHFKHNQSNLETCLKLALRYRLNRKIEDLFTHLISKFGHINFRYYILNVSFIMHHKKSYMIKKKFLKYQDEVNILKKQLKDLKINQHEARNQITTNLADLDFESNQIEKEVTALCAQETRALFIKGLVCFECEKEFLFVFLEFELSLCNYRLTLSDTEYEDLFVKIEVLILPHYVDVILELILKHFSNDTDYISKVKSHLSCAKPDVQAALKHFNSILSLKVEQDKNLEDVEMTENDCISNNKAVICTNFFKNYPTAVKLKCQLFTRKNGEVVEFLNALTEQFSKGLIENPDEMMITIRKMFDLLLVDDEWGPKAIDVWWLYYCLELRFGSKDLIYDLQRNIEYALDGKLKSDWRQRLENL